MPNYLFQNLLTEDYIDIFFKFSEVPSIGELFTNDDGIVFKRIPTIPQASIDTQADPYSEKDFVKISNKKGKYGDVIDLSAEMSAKRAEKEGEDPVKRKLFDNYEKETGKKHLLDKPKSVENNFLNIDI